MITCENHHPITGTDDMKANALKSMKIGIQNVALRMVAAENNFIEVLMNFGEISKADAEKVLAVYRKLKLVKTDAVMGVMSVKHGAYLDKATIANALSMTAPSPLS